MGIKPCKECGSPVSDKAESCPRCGAKQPKKTSVLTWICVVMLGLAALIWMYSDKTTSEPVELSVEQKALRAKASTMRAISEVLKDPDSAKFEFLNENCGTVNSKNSFGGYVGARRFVSVKDIVDLEGHTISKKEMDILWKKHCS
ncbi:zinc ribbon domain-containing protein [Acinetobacter sp. YH12251]|uniref:zinc ribbon domain-containing protein n=1 Tax=Acinetobacter sp. YH12251 TaxID=2601176 RepID=UPI0015D1ECED|nr:zinc ribbon domain-containing protein [Acinetobacter sp. YH12251]